MRPLTISNILRSVRASRTTTMNKSIIQQIEKIVKSKSPVYHYEVLNLYNYFATNHDEAAFNKVDQIFFATRSKQPTMEISLQLAYRRLYCLLKYHQPYGSWVKLTRQLLHETKVTATDVKNLLHLFTFDNSKIDKNFEQIYEEFVAIFQEQIPNIDCSTLIALRKTFTKFRLSSLRYETANEKLQGQIEQNLLTLSNAQLKFLFQAKRLTNKQFFQYFFKAHVSPIKRYAFYMIVLSLKQEWCEFFVKKFKRQELLGKLPNALIEGKPFTIVEGIFANYTSQRPYIDEFFTFVQHREGDKVVKKLANPVEDYEIFLYNALYYLFPGIKQVDSFDHIETVLSQTQYLPKSISAIFVYFTIKQSLNFFSYQQDINIKREKDMALVKQISNLIKSTAQNHSTFFKGSLILATKAFRNLAALEIEAIKLPQFQIVVESLKKLSLQHYSSLKIFEPEEFKEIYNILLEYRKQSKPKQNEMFFGEFKKYKSSNPKIQIYMARQIEVNRKVQVDYLVRVVNSETKNEIKYLLDFTYYTRSRDSKKVSLGKYWKHHYLSRWCGLQFLIEKWVPISEYIESASFQHMANRVLEK